MNARWILVGRLWQFVTPLGLARLQGYCGDDVEIRAVECTCVGMRESADERAAFPASAPLAKGTATRLDVPLLVIAHDPNDRDPDLSLNLDREVNW